MATVGRDSRLTASVAVYDAGSIGLESLELPDRRQGETDLEMTAAAICGSDLHTVLGHRATAERTALGHEGVGRVIEADRHLVDAHGNRVHPGDRVVFALFSACGDCDRCTSGLEMKCRSLVKYGHESIGTPPHATGTLASHIRLLSGVTILRIPDDVDDLAVVSAGCAVATASAIVRMAGDVGASSPVLVYGAGAVGAYCAAMFASMGHPVFVTDPSEPRLALVEQFGAKRASPASGPYPVTVEASGSPSAFVDAIGATDVAGRVLAAGSVSPGSTTVSFDPALVVTRRLSILGVHNYTPADFVWGVDWLLQHGRRLDLDQLVSPPVPLSDVQSGFDLMEEGHYHRVLIKPDGSIEQHTKSEGGSSAR